MMHMSMAWLGQRVQKQRPLGGGSKSKAKGKEKRGGRGLQVGDRAGNPRVLAEQRGEALFREYGLYLV
jgi:hypothetical protein